MEQTSYRRRQSMPTGLPTPLTRAYSADQLECVETDYPAVYPYSEPITPPCSASQHQSVLFPTAKSQLLMSGSSSGPGNPLHSDEVTTPTSISSGSNVEQGLSMQYNHSFVQQPGPFRTHSRSYSHSPNDIALAMNRVSLDSTSYSQTFTNGMASNTGSNHRPRALSSGVFDFLESYENWNRPLLHQHPSQTQHQPSRPPLATRSSQASLMSGSSASSAGPVNGAQSQYLASPFSLNRSGTQSTYTQPALVPSMGTMSHDTGYLYISPTRTSQNGASNQEPLMSPVGLIDNTPKQHSPVTPSTGEDVDLCSQIPLRRKSTSDAFNDHSRSKSLSDTLNSNTTTATTSQQNPPTKPKGPVRMQSSGSINAATGGVKSQDKKPFDSLSLSEIYALCRDQRGCRLLQRRLQENNPALVSRIFEATNKHMATLMSDPFGNYFCQKLVEYCSDEQLTSILRTIAPHMKAIALNQHGTRALQRTIEVLRLPSQVSIVTEALDGAVVELIRDLNGNHVVQKILLEFDEAGSQFIYDAVCDNIVEVGSHRHGCCVLQRCIDYASPANRHKLVSQIVANTRTLVCDPFGNYVCQYVIALKSTEYTNALGEQMLGSIATLSVQKFSSNVVEKCLRAASPELAEKIVHEIIQSRTLHTLLLDSYGNYVIQTALDSCSGETRKELAETTQVALKSTRSPYGRRIMSKLKE